MRSCNFACANI